MSFETIIYEKSDGIATIKLNRPDAANGFNQTLVDELYEATRDADFDTDVRVVVLTANGRFFSAGGDLKYMAENMDNVGSALKKMADTLHLSVNTLTRMNKPFIVGVNGTAAGAGFSAAMTGDMVICAESAKFTMAYTAAGLSPDGSSTYFLPRLIGVRKSMELMLTNKVLTATEALDWGLVNQVVPDDELETTVQKLAAKLAKGPTQAYGDVKKLLNASYSNNLETQIELEGRAIALNASAPHGMEGITAFTEKRKPNFG